MGPMARACSEDNMEVRDGQQFGLSVGEPPPGPVPGTSGSVGCDTNCRQSDLAAAAHRSTWPPRAAVRQNSMARHDPTLPVGQGGGVFGAIGGAVAAEDIRHLERGPHGDGSVGGVTTRPRRSSGLAVSAIRCVATWV